MEFDFSIEFEQGHTDVAADALSRKISWKTWLSLPLLLTLT